MITTRPIYVIVNWDMLFETYESKRLIGAATWVAMPNKHDGKSFRRITREKDAAAIYGAWALLVQVASKCPVRGVLADLDGPLDALDLEDKTGIAAKHFERTLEVATGERIGWARVITDEAEIEGLLAQVAAAGTRRSRARPQTPADSRRNGSSPAEKGRSPAAPADSELRPQTPADVRESPQNNALRGRALADKTVQDKTGQDSIPPTVPQGGTSGSEAEVKTIPPISAPSEKKSGAAEVVAMLEETRLWICSLVGRQRGLLGSTAEHELAELAKKGALPLSASDRDCLTRFYAVPADESDPLLRYRRWDADSIACNLLIELDRARRWSGVSGGIAPNAKKSAAPEPMGWRENFAKKFPRAVAPERWADLDDRIKRELLAGEEVAA